jgi:uncharacterized membrane protein (UPF0127 family)
MTTRAGSSFGGARIVSVAAPRGTIDRVVVARTFRERCVGLLSRTEVHADEGLLLVPGGSIHTFGMRFAIDVVFLSEGLQVLGVAANVRPWRCIIAPRQTRFVLEQRAHTASDLGIVRGCAVQVLPVATSPRARRAAR